MTTNRFSYYFFTQDLDYYLNAQYYNSLKVKQKKYSKNTAFELCTSHFPQFKNSNYQQTTSCQINRRNRKLKSNFFPL